MQYNALQSLQALEMGQGQRKQREYDDGRKKLGNALAGGDLAGGASMAYGMGDIETGMALQGQQKTMLDAEQEAKRTGLMRYGMSLLQTPADQREAMRPQIAQTLAQIGVELPQDQLAAMDLSDAAIQATLQSLQDPESLKKQYQAQMNPEFFAPTEILGPDGQPTMAQFSKSGMAPRTFEGAAPYQAPDQRPWWAQEGGGVDPAQLANQEAGRSPGVNINMPSSKGETKFQEGLGANAAAGFQAIIDQGRAAGASIGNLDTMEALLDSIDYTGFGGDTLLTVQRAGAMLGMEIPDLPAKEAAKRLSSQMALSLKSDLPGPMSNADREFLLSIPPNLNSSAAGNDAIIFILRKREERKQDMMQSLLQADPKSMEEYRAWENRYLQETPPMFTPKTQASLLKALGGASGEDSPQ